MRHRGWDSVGLAGTTKVIGRGGGVHAAEHEQRMFAGAVEGFEVPLNAHVRIGLSSVVRNLL